MGALRISTLREARFPIGVWLKDAALMIRRAPIILAPIAVALLFQKYHPTYAGLPEVTAANIADGSIGALLISYGLSRPLYVLAVSSSLSLISGAITFASFRCVFNALFQEAALPWDLFAVRDVLLYALLYQLSLGAYLALFALVYFLCVAEPGLLTMDALYAPVLAFPAVYAWLSVTGFAITLGESLRERARTLAYLGIRGAATLLVFYAIRLAAEAAIVALCFGIGLKFGAAPVLSFAIGVTLALIPFAIIRNTGYLLKVRLMRRAPLMRRLIDARTDAGGLKGHLPRPIKK